MLPVIYVPILVLEALAHLAILPLSVAATPQGKALG